nr:hypothetical protein Iba_chr07aCG5900 [Ipomoea batatas]GMD17828.1 hypothetical protein Iba_chr07dCG7360 [Ipomoea batatas]
MAINPQTLFFSAQEQANPSCTHHYSSPFGCNPGMGFSPSCPGRGDNEDSGEPGVGVKEALVRARGIVFDFGDGGGVPVQGV